MLRFIELLAFCVLSPEGNGNGRLATFDDIARGTTNRTNGNEYVSTTTITAAAMYSYHRHLINNSVIATADAIAAAAAAANASPPSAITDLQING